MFLRILPSALDGSVGPQEWQRNYCTLCKRQGCCWIFIYRFSARKSSKSGWQRTSNNCMYYVVLFLLLSFLWEGGRLVYMSHFFPPLHFIPATSSFEDVLQDASKTLSLPWQVHQFFYYQESLKIFDETGAISHLLSASVCVWGNDYGHGALEFCIFKALYIRWL